MIANNWRDYERIVAEFFREQGCEVELGGSFQGVRGSHKVDVHVSFLRHGIRCTWIVECKLWDKRVPKEKIHALKSIVDDIGADRGIIFSESGFQSGAYESASQSNITLVESLEEFRRTAITAVLDVPLIERPDPDGRLPSVFEFPRKDQPQSIIAYGQKILVGNWGTGNVSIIDPERRSVEAVIELDRYRRPGEKDVRTYVPGDMAIAGDTLFLGQVFSEFVLVIDLETKSIVKRIPVPGGGQGAITSSTDGRLVFFASNLVNKLFVIDVGSQSVVAEVDYPQGGRGCLAIRSHPDKPLVYLAIQRGGRLDGVEYPGGNCFLATYDTKRRAYLNTLYLADVRNGRSDDAMPVCLTVDPVNACVYVGMMQARRGVIRVSDDGGNVTGSQEFESFVDSLAQQLWGQALLSVNRNTAELVMMDRNLLAVTKKKFLGKAPNGPSAVAVSGSQAIVCYPYKRGLVFLDLPLAD